MFSAPKLNLSYTQMALGLQLFLDTNQKILGNEPLSCVYGVTRSSYDPKMHFVLVGTTNGPSQWVSVHPSNGLTLMRDGLCEGWTKPEIPDPRFVAALTERFTVQVINSYAARRECAHAQQK